MIVAWVCTTKGREVAAMEHSCKVAVRGEAVLMLPGTMLHICNPLGRGEFFEWDVAAGEQRLVL